MFSEPFYTGRWHLLPLWLLANGYKVCSMGYMPRILVFSLLLCQVQVFQKVLSQNVMLTVSLLLCFGVSLKPVIPMKPFSDLLTAMYMSPTRLNSMDSLTRMYIFDLTFVLVGIILALILWLYHCQSMWVTLSKKSRNCLAHMFSCAW